MEHAWSVFLNCLDMLWGPIPFVSCKSIQRIRGICFSHYLVACDLGNDRRSSNTRLKAISFDEGTMRIVEPKCIAPVDEEICRSDMHCEHAHRFLHGFIGRFQYSNVIDFLCGCASNSKRTLGSDPCVCMFTLFFGQFFAIKQANISHVFRRPSPFLMGDTRMCEMDSASNNRAC